MVQVKGHVFEATSCGSMLMEAENSEASKLFEPMFNYVPFKDEKDLVDKVKYYLAYESERQRIAAKGHQKSTQKYSGETWWKTVLEGVFGSNLNSTSKY